ncbi:MAG TPA: methyltransferase, TIGR04325 family [Xanthobacteraceae bacterium]|nr:methyltransferase, TIGR04325 family [Xanthobacteraceae bacterium]
MSVRRQILELVGSAPLLRPVARMAYERRFAQQFGGERLFRGIYSDFSEAAASAPRSSFTGHDNVAYVSKVAVHEHEAFTASSPYASTRARSSDYPILFWLSKILPSAARIFDWGGCTGISYYVYREYLAFPDRLEWIVNDVPGVVALGRELTSQQDASQLTFTTDLTLLENCDIVISAGSLQMIEEPFALLKKIPKLPPHFFINKVPVLERPSVVTLCNNGASYCPYRLLERADLIRNMEDLGFALVDEWEIPELSCRIPFHPEFSVPHYAGFYFCRREAASARKLFRNGGHQPFTGD